MVDDQPPPRTSPTTRVLIPQGTAASLAFFTTSSDAAHGVLAPRAWSCHAQSGSNGDVLYVVPPDAVFDPVNGGYRGPMVRRRFADGATSGRFEVARVAGRLFPQARGFAERVRDEGVDEPGTYAFSPWPHDRIQRLSKTVVTFATPGGTRGLGHPGGPPYGLEETSGVVVFETSADGDPALLRLDVRLGSGTDLLASAIATAFLARLDVPKGPSDTIVPSPPIVTGSDATAVVRAFYEALGRADGRVATSLVVPERRNSGPYASQAISKFYASLADPLRLTSIRSLAGGEVEVRYRYRKGTGPSCDGLSIATVTRSDAGSFIARIRPINGC
ncbi:hypothetical protein [Methylobacterium sp. 190mf]|uniref:hypothetical protein n=1 Tax=Methylobacterium sp. 190mf TaxID=1761798 RepID=UPI0011B04826|nr:hypothetical protein [Methylobacterium sp. 190mf]